MQINNFMAHCYAFMMVRGLKFMHHIEHLAVAAYSAAEVFGLHYFIWYISLSLIFIGVAGLIYEFLQSAE